MSNRIKVPVGVTLRGDRNQCAECGELFNSSRAFEKHRTGEHGVSRRCLSTDEMLAKGMIKGADGFWRGSAMPADVLGSIVGVADAADAA